jgi:hypothetical protein
MLRRCSALGLPGILALLPSLSPAAENPSAVAAKAFRHPQLHIPVVHERAAAASARTGRTLAAELAALDGAADSALFDVRAGRWNTLVTRTPLLPGRGNELRWADLGLGAPARPDAVGERAWSALLGLLERWRSPLRIDPSEIGRPRVSVSAGGALVHLYAPRVVAGVPVRGAALSAVVNHGNLVLLGLDRWGDLARPSPPAVDAARAREAAAEHLRPHVIEAFAGAHLELIPLARGEDARAIEPGAGYEHRLAWVVRARVAGDIGSWEALVDAASGELLSLEDTNQYQSSRSVVGGVFPATNDGLETSGLEQPGYPMPYADVVTGAGTEYATTGGVVSCVDGAIATTLNGRYVRIADGCGPVHETSSGSLDLGTSGGTNCTVPAGHSAGDTHAARTTYYELNRIMEQARGYLPTNEWLQRQLVANVNIDQNCNAFWNGATVNFVRAGGGCANTGELAGIVDHEFAHGLDNNAGDPTIARPGEAMGHVLTALRQQDSCIGRGFLPAQNCGGYGDPCTACNGIEDVDYARHASASPHGLAFIQASCPAFGTRGPCDREQHCEALIVAEAIWDLATRDLRNPATFNYDANTAFEVTTRLTYLGGQLVASWYQCTAGSAGCGATGGYLQFLAADDDNGNLGDGTPHMSAITAAFGRHGLACSSVVAADSGCAGGPTAAPTLTATPLDGGASLSWTAVAGATRYEVFRAEGLRGCDAGKVKIGETTATTFRDEGLLNGFSYRYAVWPVGLADGCRGRMSACQAVVPAPGPALAFERALPVQPGAGDGDEFLDNCEAATALLVLQNTGSTTLHNVRIVDVAPVGSPLQVLDAVPIEVASRLGVCEAAKGGVAFLAQGLGFDMSAELLVTYTADELFPQTRTARLVYTHAESDFEPRPSRTFSFETDLEGWQVVSGSFTRASAGGGANGTSFYVRSSQSLDNACDRIRSPLLRLSETSTLSLGARYVTEPPSFGEHYDRANLAVVGDDGHRNVVSPDGGNLYNVPADAPLFTCSRESQPGWEGTNPGNPAFSPSTWSAAALSPGGVATGSPVRLDVFYATDVVLSLDGFRFDEVTLTDFAEQQPDAQADSCPGVAYFDGFDDDTPPPWDFDGPWRRQGSGILSSRRQPATAIATDFGGCDKCALTTRFRLAGGPRRPAEPHVTLYLHWEDKENYVAAEFMDGVATLSQVVGGEVVNGAKAPFAIGRGRWRQATVAYDGGGYSVSVDGALLLVLRSEGGRGTFGLGVSGARTAFDFVEVR